MDIPFRVTLLGSAMPSPDPLTLYGGKSVVLCRSPYPITPPRLMSSLPTAARCTWSGPSPMRMKRA